MIRPVVDEVAEHEEVGGKEEDGEEDPTELEVAIELDGGDEEAGVFELEKEGRMGEH